MENIVTNKAIKYRIYPTSEQKSILSQMFGCVRFVYNEMLNMQQGLYEAGMGSMSTYDLNSYCNHVLKETHPFLREVDKFALTNSIMNLQKARKNFFEKRTGFPKYKSKHDAQSYTTNMTQNNISIELPSKENGHQGRIKLPKVKWIDASIHRAPGKDWAIKQATVSMDTRDQYYVSVLFEITTEISEKVIPTLEKTLGLDYSSPHFYVDSNGETPNVPKAFRRIEKRLAKEQRKLSHMTKGSNNYIKQKKVVARLHAIAANQRKDFCHQLSRKITNFYDVVCVEDINLCALSQTLHLGKATLDNGFGMFRTFLKYKLEEEGKYYVVIDKWYPSTKTCHNCGEKNQYVQLGDQTWVCPHCGAVIERDKNAALNIKEKGFETLIKELAAVS